MTSPVLRYAAFTTDPSGGNPAGIVLDATGLDADAMQRIAAEVGYSETAFHVDGSLRYFSPVAEVPFCGHATVATAVALAEREGPGSRTFATPVGSIPVTTYADRRGLRAELTSAPTSSAAADPADVTAALTTLGWSTEDLDPAWPPRVAFGGNHHLVLAAATRDRLARLDYAFDDLRMLMLDRGWTTLLLVHVDASGLVHARNPFPVGGVVEDPATGSAAAAFGGYLLALGRVDAPTTVRIEQGVDLGRPSELLVEVDPADARVRVSGHAVPMT